MVMNINIASYVYTIHRSSEPIVRQGIRKAGELDWANRRLLIDGELPTAAAWETFTHEVLEAFETHIPPPEDREQRVDWATTIKSMMAAALAEITAEQLMALPADTGAAPSPAVSSDVRLKTSKFKHLAPEHFEIAKHLWTKYGLDPWDNEFHVQLVPTRDGLDVRLCLHQAAIEGMARASDEWAGVDAPEFDYDDGEYPTRCRVTVYRRVNGIREPFVGEAVWRECFGTDVDQLPEVVRNKPETCLEGRALVKILRRAFGLQLYLRGEFDTPGEAKRRAPAAAIETAEQVDGPQSADGMHAILAERFAMPPIERKKLVARTALTFGERVDGDEVRFYAAVIAAAEAGAKRKAG